MTLRTFVGMVATSAVMVAVGTTPAAAACCDHQNQACCEKSAMSCCDRDGQTPEAIAVLIPLPTAEPRPARETMTVWFKNPVKIGDRILLGRYVIEHDNDRMARGRPCTHIYAASDPRFPVVAFHCTHLTRAAGAKPSVTLVSLGEPNGMKRLTEFQFAGEVGAHGAPVSSR
jgi:hypothetical protein